MMRCPLILLFLFLEFLSLGCASTTRLTVPGDEIPLAPTLRIISVITKSGDVIRFDHEGGRYVERNRPSGLAKVIVGSTEDSQHIEIDVEDAVEVKIEQKQSNSQGSLVGGFLLGIAVGSLGFFLVLLGGAGAH